MRGGSSSLPGRISKPPQRRGFRAFRGPVCKRIANAAGGLVSLGPVSDSSHRRCVFCGAGGKMDQEHVLPDWLGRELPDLGEGWHERIGAFGVSEGRWHNAPFTVTVGTVCPKCNQGWMSDLEGEV